MTQNQDQHTSIILKTDPQPKQYEETGYRWINLTIYLLAALVNSLPTQTFSSINSLVTESFSYDPMLVTLNVLVFPILHPICAFPANWILDRLGIKIGCSLGAVLVVCGVWMRTLLEEHQIGWCLMGSILAAIGNVFILNSPSILASSWFKPSSIPGIISFSVLTNVLSMTLGSSLPGLLIPKKQTPEQTQIKIKNFLEFQCLVITIPMLLLILFLRSHPSSPPSKSAQNQQNKNNVSYWALMSALFVNRQYLFVMGVMTFHYGCTTSYLANLDRCLWVLGMQRSGFVTARILLAAMLAGIVSSFFFISRVKRTLNYTSNLNLCLLLSFIMFCVLQLALIMQISPDSWILDLLGAGTGMFLIPTTSILMAYCSEVVFPLGEGSATGYLFASSQTFGFILGLSSASTIKTTTKPTRYHIYILMLVHGAGYLVASILGNQTSNKLNRTNFQYSIQKIQENSQ